MGRLVPSNAVDGRDVDEILRPAQLVVLGFQHVLVLYIGAVAVPLIIAGALGLPPEQRAILISSDVLACGLATLVQSVGFPGVGMRLPMMMGVSFTSVAPMLGLIAAAKDVGGPSFEPAAALAAIFCGVIAAGILAFLLAPLMGGLLHLFPPVVTGTIVLVIGVSLMGVAVDWAEGPHMVPDIIDGGSKAMIPNPDRGALTGLGITLLVVLVILALAKFGKGFAANIAVLLGIVAGAAVAAVTGKMTFVALAAAPAFGFVMPFQFGLPRPDFGAMVTMCAVMIVVMIQSTGMFLALGDITGRRLAPSDITSGLRALGLGTVLGGVFNTFPVTGFSQNVGLVGITGVYSRWVAAAGGLILIALSFLPKLAAVVASVPEEVLGGAGIVMFGMVAATGMRILSEAKFHERRDNLYIAGIALGTGLIPLVAPEFFKNFSPTIQSFIGSGIILATIVAVLLNVYFNGISLPTTRPGQLTNVASGTGR